jgi:hypothetical protein
MCGLVGFQSIDSGKLNILRAKMLLQYLSESRGKDSTGIFSPEIGVVKNADSASKFLEGMYDTKDIDFSKLNDSKIFIGHVRQKTHGEKKATNAHPFRYENIVGAHNGVINNHTKLIPEGQFPIDYPVDSMVIFARLHKDNNYKVLSEMIGAAAILFYNYKEPTILYAYRNSDRPLCYGFIEGEGIYFGSTEESLKVIDCTNIKEIKENILYKFENGKIKTSFKVARASDPDSLLVSNFSEIKELKDLFGFNLLVKQTSSYYNKGILNDSDYTYIKGYIKASHGPGNSSFQVQAAQNFEDKDNSGSVYTSELDINSYNAFFKKGNIVRAVRDFDYQTTKKNKKKVRACIKHELFIIVKPLTSRTQRSVTVTSLLDSNKDLLMDVSHLEAITTQKLLTETADEIGFKLEDEVKRVETLIDSVSPEEINKFKGITEEKIYSVLDTKLRKVLNLESKALDNNQFRSIIENQLNLNFDELDNNNLTKSLERTYQNITKLKEQIANSLNLLGDDFKIGDLALATLLDELEQISMDVISIYDNHSVENSEHALS